VGRRSSPPPTAAPSPTGTATPLPTPARTLLPTATAARPPTSTPVPTPPLLTLDRAGAAGSPPFSLQRLLNADVHLTAGLPALRHGRPVFVLASLDRNVYSVGLDGTRQWRVRAAAPVYALAVLDEGQVAAGDDAGQVTLLDSDGRLLWRHAFATRVTALEGPWQGGLLAGGWDRRLTLLNADKNGERVRWSVELGGPVSDIVSLPGAAVAATLEGTVTAVGAGGARLWQVDAGAPVTRLGMADRDSPRAGAAPPALLAGTQDGRLLALAEDGTLLWERAFGAGGAGSPVWRVARLAGQSGPAIAVGTGGTAPELALLSMSGGWLWRVALPSPAGAVSASDLDRDGEAEILVGLANGEILALDEQGRFLGTVQAGLGVWDLVPGEEAGAAGTLVLANVLASQLIGAPGPAVKPRLSPPAMLAESASVLPALRHEARPQGQAVLAFLGDVSLGRSVELQLARYGPASPWTGLSPLLGDADLAAANLEVALTTHGKPLNKPYAIRADPRWGEALAEAGFDLVALANNHTLDFGDAGHDETLATLKALNIAPVGAGASYAEAHRPARFTLNGVRLAVLAYAGAYWNGSADVPATDRIAWADPQAIRADVQAVHDQVDVLIVVLHAGREYTSRPSSAQVTAAHAAVEAGADLVVGHHPHVTQTVERYRGGLIVYSLGDAVFDIPFAAAMQGDLLRVAVTREGLAWAELWPFWIDQAFRPRLLDDGKGGPRVERIYP
jgi:poly-gamma-glutamate synthesis protein (capsule biosynthesis protein)